MNAHPIEMPMVAPELNFDFSAPEVSSRFECVELLSDPVGALYISSKVILVGSVTLSIIGTSVAL